MHCIRSCSSCNVKLRIPLNRGILVIICPNCNNRFEFNSDQQLAEQESPHSSYSPVIDIPKLPRLNKNHLIGFLLFFILAIYIIRGYSSPDKEIPDRDSIFQEERPELEIEEKSAPFSI